MSCYLQFPLHVELGNPSYLKLSLSLSVSNLRVRKNGAEILMSNMDQKYPHG